MKKFTIISSCFLVTLLVGLCIYVGLSEDFVPPKNNRFQTEDDKDAPIWNMTLEEVCAQLEEKSGIPGDAKVPVANGGLCSKGVVYDNIGVDVYWWDLENLKESSAEYKAYESLCSEGFIDLYNAGIILSPVRNGPFGILIYKYNGDVDELAELFCSIGKAGS